MIVIDASVLVPALSDDTPDGERARLRLQAENLICAPELIDLEAASAWRRALRSGRFSEERSHDALDDLSTMSLVRMPHLPLMPRVWELRHNLSPYDASYVALAEGLETTLLTADRRLARAPGLHCPVELMR